MTHTGLELPDAVRRKALAGGAEGVVWLSELAQRVDDLARRWELTMGRMFPGGTEAFVASPGPGPRRFQLVHPDGLFIERAYDLGIPMRERGAELLAGDPVRLGQRRCRQLARRTGVAFEAIWQWGFVERVSTGLLLQQLGLEPQAREFLRVADAWAKEEEPG